MMSDAQWAGFIQWIKGSIEHETDDQLGAAQVIQADQDYPSPPETYLTLRLLSVGNLDGSTAEIQGDEDGNIAIRDEELTISVQGFGPLGLGYLLAIQMGMELPDLWAPLDAQGLSVDQIAGITNLSAVLDTGFQAQYQMDLRLRYRRTSRRLDFDALQSAQIGVILRRFDGDPDPLTDTVEIAP